MTDTPSSAFRRWACLFVSFAALAPALRAQTAPTMSAVPNQTINEDTSTGALAFTVGDAETAASSLTITGHTSNSTLVPTANIVFGGSGANRTVTVTPAANQSGYVRIEIVVSDGSLSTGNMFEINVNSVNDAPGFDLPSDIIWTERESIRFWNAIATSSNGNKLSAVDGNGFIYTSTDAGVNWVPRLTDTNRSWRSITSSADGSKLAAVAQARQIYTSTDSGLTWVARDSVRQWQSITSSADGNKLAAVVYGGFIYTSTDLGATWVPRMTDMNRNWQSISYSADGSKLAAVVSNGHIHTSTDGGLTWTARMTDIARIWQSITSSADGNKLAAIVYNGQIYTSTDAGANWTARETARLWRNIASSANGNKLVAVVGGSKIHTSNDSGATWTARESNRNWLAVALNADGSRLPTAEYFGKIYTSTINPNSITVAGGSGPFTLAGFATGITPGPANESSQTVSFTATNLQNSRFTSQPAISPSGTLTFTPGIIASANQVFVTAVDNGGTANGGDATSETQIFTINITNSAPTNIALSSSIIAENNAPNATVGTFSSTDPNPGNTFTYSFASGGADNASFTISGNALRLTPSADFETKSSYAIRIRSTDQGGLFFEKDFSISITNVNEMPSFTKGANQSHPEGTTASQSFSAWATAINDGDSTVIQTLTFNLSVVSGDTIFTTRPSVSSAGTLTYKPNGTVGTATINISLTDDTTPGGSALTTAVQTFTITVSPNTTPTISNVADQTISEDGTTGALAVTIGDAETPAASLILTASSNNTTLVPNGSFAYGGSGANRTVTVTPVGNQSGTAIITLSVSDGLSQATDSFLLTVNAVNDAPTISDVANQTINEDGNTGALAVAIGDAETPAGSLTLIGSSTNTTLVPNGSFSYGGSGANRAVIVTPVGNQSGTATITLTVSDGSLPVATDTFVLTVNPVNDVPVFTKGANKTHLFGTTAAQSFSGWATAIDDGDAAVTQALAFNVSVASGGTIFSVPPAVSSTGTLTYTPNGTDGTATINVSLTDDATAGGGALTSPVQTFTITVSPNTAPTIGNVVDQTINEDTATVALAITIGDVETSAASLTVSGTSSNTTLVPDGNANITFGGSGANRTVTVTPASNQSGTTTITLTVSDGNLTATDTFVLTVNAVNDAPGYALSAPSVVVVTDSGLSTTPLFAAGISPGPPDESSQSVTGFNVTNNNNALFTAQPAIAPDGTLTFTPGSTVGSATVSVAAVDDGGTANGGSNTSAIQTFTITINPNTPPTISDVADQAIDENTATNVLPITIGDQDTPAASLVMSGSSSNTTLVPDANIVFGGSGVNRTVIVTPAPNQNGTATITLTVSDGSLTATDTFLLTVNGANSAPSFDFPAGAKWTARMTDAPRAWFSIASSADGTKLAAVVIGGQIYTSTDSGATWTARETNRNWWSIASSADGSNLAAVERGGQIHTSTDSGATWTPRETSRLWRAITSSANGTKLAAVVDSGGQIYTSTDAGENWTPRETNRNWISITSSADGTKLAATVSAGQIYTSTDSGENWTPQGANRNWWSIASSADGSKLAAAAYQDHIYTSTDSGVTWTARPVSGFWLSIASSADGRKLAALAHGGQVYTSTDSGLTWTARSTGANYSFYGGIASSGDGSKLAIAGSSWFGATYPYTSTSRDYNVTVAASSGPSSTANAAIDISPGPPDESSQTVSFTVTNDNNALFTVQPAIAPDGTLTFTPGAVGGVATVTVTAVDSGGTANGGVNTSASKTFTITINGLPTIADIPNQSINEDPFTSGITIPITIGDLETPASSLTVTGSSSNQPLVPGTYPDFIFGGSGSARTLTLLPKPDMNGTTTITVYVSDGLSTVSDTFVLTVNAVNDAPRFGLVTHVPAGRNWTPRETNRNWNSITSSADGSKLAAAVSNGQIYTSTDSGVIWTPRETARYWRSITSSADGSKLAGVSSYGVGNQILISVDSGLTWEPRETSRYWSSIASSADGIKLAAVAQSDRIYTSTDSGLTWTPRETSRNWSSIASSADGSNLAAVELGGLIHTSTDSGETWTARETNRNWVSIASSADGSKLAAVAYGGSIYTSTDWGVNWTAREASRVWFSITSSADGSKLAAVDGGGQIYTSTDSGLTWTARETARNWASITSSDDGNKLAAVVSGGKIYTSTSIDTDITVFPNSGPSTTAAFAHDISPGPSDESAQTVSFNVTNNSNALFTVQPAIAPNGSLTFTPGGTVGSATVSVTAADNGGTANGGINTSATRTFTINIIEDALAGWRTFHFPGGGNSGNLADPDFDGTPNLVEYAFGLDPNSGGSGQPPSAVVSGGEMCITFTQPPGVTGITYGAEWSPDMVSWYPVTDTGSGNTHHFCVPMGNYTNLYMRHRITQP